MYCSRCGKQLADGEVCACRQQIPRPVPQQPVMSQPAPAQPVMSHPAPAQQTATGVLKKSLSSWVFLTVAILYSVILLFTFLIPLTTDYNALLSELEYGLGVDLGGFISGIDMNDPAIRASIAGSTVSSCILPGLICAGLWMLYTGARSKETVGVKSGGFIMLKVVTIINFVGMCVVFVIAALATFVVMSLASANSGFTAGGYLYTFDDPEVIIAVCLLLLVVLAMAAALMIVMYLKGLKTLNGAMKVASTGMPNNKASMFLVVMLYIAAGGGLLSGLQVVAQDGLAALLTLCQAAYCFFAAFGLMKYRSEMKKVCSSSKGHVWVEPESQPQPYTIAYISCEQCGQQYSSELDKCPKCGASNFTQR